MIKNSGHFKRAILFLTNAMARSRVALVHSYKTMRILTHQNPHCRITTVRPFESRFRPKRDLLFGFCPYRQTNTTKGIKEEKYISRVSFHDVKNVVSSSYFQILDKLHKKSMRVLMFRQKLHGQTIKTLGLLLISCWFTFR